MQAPPSLTCGKWIEFAWAFFCFAVPLSVAGANMAWGLALLGLACAAAAGLELDWRSLKAPLFPSLWLYVAAAVLAAALATDPRYSFHFLYKDVHKLWLCLLLALSLSFISPKGERWMLAALLAGSAAAAAVGIYQSMTQINQDGLLIARAHAFVHPVTFGELSALIVLGMGCFLWRRPPWLTPKLRVAVTTALALTTAALFLSQTRGAMLGAAAGVALLCLTDARLKKKALVLIGVALVAAIVADLMEDRSVLRVLYDHFAHSGELVKPPTERLQLWHIAWAMFRDHPWTGVGLNNFRANSPRYFTGLLNGERAMGTAHNLYLHQLAERGVIGMGALLALFAVLWARGWRRFKEQPNAWTQWALAATAAFTVMNLTEVALQTEQVWMLFFFVWCWAERHAQKI